MINIHVLMIKRMKDFDGYQERSMKESENAELSNFTIRKTMNREILEE